MADLNGDGFRDVLSGSWPGEIYFFAGAKDGAYEEAVTLKNSGGEAVNVGQASALALHDWDGDGDLDLIIGDIEGDVTFVPNLGGNGLPAFGDAQPVKAAGEAILVGGDAGPTVADWDGDGIDDLICGDQKGAVWLFRATGRDDRRLPVLAKGVELIPAISDEARAAAYENPVDDLEGKLITRPGDRTKVCVTDWNDDGRLDLLVGDVQTTTSAAVPLTAEDIAERDRLRASQEKIMERYSALWKQLDAKLRDRLGVEADAELTTEQQEQWGSLWAEVSKEVEGFEEVSKELQDLWPKLSRFEPQREYHGWVWVYLHKPAASAAGETTDSADASPRQER